jgi:hypothetical protein
VITDIADKFDKEYMLCRVLIIGDCWEWQRAIGSEGYGNVFDNSAGKTYKAHRLAYELFVGPVGEKWVLHRCDNRKCCNPAHLFLGTHKDNMDDMAKKKRAHVMPGTLNPNAKLSDADIQAIRAIPRQSLGGMTNAEIALRYGVCKETIRRYRKDRQFKFEKVGGSYRERR